MSKKTAFALVGLMLLVVCALPAIAGGKPGSDKQISGVAFDYFANSSCYTPDMLNFGAAWDFEVVTVPSTIGCSSSKVVKIYRIGVCHGKKCENVRLGRWPMADVTICDGVAVSCIAYM